MLSRDALSRLVPHAGAMCLLDAVERYDDESITCRAGNHRDAAHPLRERGMLDAVCAIEYAAQAMAVHGALVEASGAREGMLAAVRDVVLHVERLDDVLGDLTIDARRLVAESDRLLYAFAVTANGAALVDGRAIVVLASREAP
jgi:predicted hotdog family 3-hydroxylacyl-ACP dehydratase